MSNKIIVSPQVEELSDEELSTVAGGVSFGTVNGGINNSNVGDNSNNNVDNSVKYHPYLWY